MEDIFLCKVHREVLGIDVVVDFAEVSLVTRLVSDYLVFISITLGFESTLSTGGVLEANEAIATGLMVGAEGDFQRFDVTIAGEVLLQLWRAQCLGDFADKDVVVNNLLRVRSEEIVVEGQGAGGLTIGQLEVTHLFASKSKLVILGDRHDG